MKHIVIKSLAGLLFFCIILSSCKKPNEVVLREDKEDFSQEDQVEMGNNLSHFLDRHAPGFTKLDRSTHEAFYAYLDKILQTVVNNILVETREVFNWEITVLQDDSRYAIYTIPGGKIEND